MFQGKNTDLALLLLRLAFGGMMLYHGLGKAKMLFTGDPSQFPDLTGLGAAATLALVVFAEVLCSVLVMLGAFTRWALVPLMVAMLVAIFAVHWGDPFPDMEKALAYLAVYVALWLAGPGWHSVDERLRKP